MKRAVLIAATSLVASIIFTGCIEDPNKNPGFYEDPNYPQADKPAIYVYTEKTHPVNIKLSLNGELGFTYPEYQNEWNIIANPDGKIIDTKTQKEYEYLFWEGKLNTTFNIDEGFCVKREDTVKFLTDSLKTLGLNDNEINDFIVYWGPRLYENRYNVIKFETTNYIENAQLKISPKPDNIIRVFIVYYGLDREVLIQSQDLEALSSDVSREGYTVVEWGGCECTQ